MLELRSNEYPTFYRPYIDILDKNNDGIIKNLEDSLQQALLLMEGLSEKQQLYRYADGKWAIKELVQHIIDAERIFAYRALTFARNDIVVLPGFDEDNYVLHSNANTRPFHDLLEELKSVRRSTISLFKSFVDSDMEKSGTASGKMMSVRALGYIISGHLLHHLKIIEERYLA